MVLFPPVAVVFHKNSAVRRSGAGILLIPAGGAGGPEEQEGVRKLRIDAVPAHFVILCPDIDGKICREAIGRNDAGQFPRFRKSPVRIDGGWKGPHGLHIIAGQDTRISACVSPAGCTAVPGVISALQQKGFQRFAAHGILLPLRAGEGPDAVGIVCGYDQDAACRQETLCRCHCGVIVFLQRAVKQNVIEAAAGRDVSQCAAEIFRCRSFRAGAGSTVHAETQLHKIQKLRILFLDRDLQPLLQKHPGQGSRAAAGLQERRAFPEGKPLQQSFSPVGKHSEILQCRVFGEQRFGIPAEASAQPFQFSCSLAHLLSSSGVISRSFTSDSIS